MMKYKGYAANLEIDTDAGILHGEIADITDVVTFQATSVDELRREFETSVDNYLEYCRDHGREPNRPYSGRFVVRITPALHRDVAVAARRQGVSMNAWITAACEEALGRRSPPAVRSAEGWADFEAVHAALARYGAREGGRGSRVHANAHAALPAKSVTREVPHAWTGTFARDRGKGVAHGKA